MTTWKEAYDMYKKDLELRENEGQNEATYEYVNRFYEASVMLTKKNNGRVDFARVSGCLQFGLNFSLKHIRHMDPEIYEHMTKRLMEVLFSTFSSEDLSEENEP